MNQIYFLFGLFLLDMVLTFYYINKVKTKYPAINIYNCEGNPLLKFCWKGFGFVPGHIIGAIILAGFLYFLVSYVLNDWWLIFFCGVYTMMNIMHFTQINMLERQVKNV